MAVKLKQVYDILVKDWKKFTWIQVLGFLICSGFVIKKCTESWMKFADRKLTTMVAIKSIDDMEFPAITVCPKYENSYKDDVLRQYGSNLSHYRSGYIYMDPKITEKNAFEIYDEVTFKLHEVVAQAEIKTIKNSYEIHPSESEMLNKINQGWRWKSLTHHYYGICYALEISDEIVSEKVLEVSVVGHIPFYYILHHKGQFYLYDYRAKISIDMKTNMYLTFSHNIHINPLTPEYSKIPCSGGMNYNFSQCLIDGMAEMMDQEFGCILPYLKYNSRRDKYNTKRGKYKPCDFYGNNTLAKIAFKRYQNLRTNMQNEICQRPCTLLDFDIAPLIQGTIKDDRPRGQIDFKPTGEEITTVLAYDALNLTAEIGGYVGLFLGISIFWLTRKLEEAVKHVILVMRQIEWYN